MCLLCSTTIMWCNYFCRSFILAEPSLSTSHLHGALKGNLNKAWSFQEFLVDDVTSIIAETATGHTGRPQSRLLFYGLATESRVNNKSSAQRIIEGKHVARVSSLPATRNYLSVLTESECVEQDVRGMNMKVIYVMKKSVGQGKRQKQTLNLTGIICAVVSTL